MAPSGAVKCLAQTPFPFAVYHPHDAFSVHERGIQQPLNALKCLRGIQPVKVDFRYVASGLSQEEQRFGILGTFHGFSITKNRAFV